ncbi:MAG: prohibitin family protein [Caldilineaceae bacterium]
MNIDRLLHYITIISWLLFTFFTMLAFVRTARRAGWAVALRYLISARLIMPFVLLIGISLLSAALVFVNPQEVGVVISIFSPQGVRERPLAGGLHWIVPLAENLQTYPIAWQTYTMSTRAYEGEARGDDSITARTSDGQEVIFDSSVIFRIDPPQAVRIHIDWQDRYIHDFVRPIVRGVIRTEVAAFKVDEVNSIRRQDIESTLQNQLEAMFQDKGLILDRFILRNIAFSSEYAASVEHKQVALEGATQRTYEAEQIRRLAAGHADEIRTVMQAEADALVIKAQAEATAAVVRAEAAARAQVIQAEADARAINLVKAALAGDDDLLRYRYIEKLSPAVRVMLVPNDNPYLLPLPDLDTANLDSAPPLTVTPTITQTVSLTPTARPTAVNSVTVTPVP